ncbi:Metallo-dependent phosphatase-like protein [Xylariales sp. PMI_506]|nr:Metallo-dependent phosphatase-like protein [Xylariales sp. PMI_506]
MLSSVLVAASVLAGPVVALLDKSGYNSQVRTAYHGPNGMTVSWNTFSKLDNPTVKYGLTPSILFSTASSGESVTYNSSDTYSNHVRISGLQPDTLYYYMPSSLLPNETSTGPYTFKTAKAAGDKTPYTAAFVCDLGTMGSEGLSSTAGKGVNTTGLPKPGQKNTIDSMTSLMDEYEMVLHPGDIAYADYWLKEEQQGYLPNTTYADGYKVYNSILNEFYDEFMPVTAYKPWMVGPGNHEANCDNGGSGATTASLICPPGLTNFTGYRNHFRMPSDVSGGFDSFWYSFDYGMVHYVFYDTETDLGHNLIGPDEAPSTENSGPFGLMNQQVDWLEKDLAGVDRCKTPWVVALGHRPWFISSKSNTCTNCSLAFAPLFEKYSVDVVLSGHVHTYERNYPVFVNGSLDPNGYNNPSTPMYITNGIAGHYDGMDSLDIPAKPYQAVGIDLNNGTAYGWSLLHFYNSTHMKQEFVASSNNAIIDSVVLYKDHKCAASNYSSTATASKVSVFSLLCH